MKTDLNKSLNDVLNIMPPSFFTEDMKDCIAIINWETKLENQKNIAKTTRKTK